MKDIIARLIAGASFCMGVTSCVDNASQTEADDYSKFKSAPKFTLPVLTVEIQALADVRFGIADCIVYKAENRSSGQLGWSLLFKPAPYALPQSCVRERLEFDGEYIQIEIGTQALGAGGCCTNYAAYRSKDGQNWEIRPATSISEWQTLAEQP